MNVEAAMPRRHQDRNGQDETVSRHDCSIEIERGEIRLSPGISKTDGRPDFDAESLRPLMNRRRPPRLASPGPAWRLRIDGGDVMARRRPGIERRPGEIRSSHEGEDRKSVV